jgi:cation:H+ antiporter
MSTAVGLIALAGGVTLVIWPADVFVDGLLGVGRALGIVPFVLTVALSGFETENLAAGVAANAKGLPGAAAGTFLGGVTFLALGVAGLGGVIAPMQVALPSRFAVWTAVAPVPLLAFALDGRVSRVEGTFLVAWSVVALVGLARTGRGLLGEENGERTRWPGVRLLVGLAVLTGGGWLLGEGLRSTVRNLGISQTLLGNTAVAASVEAEELAPSPFPLAEADPSLPWATSAPPSSTSRRSTPGSSPWSNRSILATTPRTSTCQWPRQARRSSPCCFSFARGSVGSRASG